MVSKLQRVLKNHLNHFAIKTGVDFFKCVQKLVTQVDAVWLRLDVGTSTIDFTGHLSFGVCRIFQKFVDLFHFGGNNENLPGHLLVALNIRAKVANHVLDG